MRHNMLVSGSGGEIITDYWEQDLADTNGGWSVYYTTKSFTVSTYTSNLDVDAGVGVYAETFITSFKPGYEFGSTLIQIEKIIEETEDIEFLNGDTINVSGEIDWRNESAYTSDDYVEMELVVGSSLYEVRSAAASGQSTIPDPIGTFSQDITLTSNLNSLIIRVAYQSREINETSVGAIIKSFSVRLVDRASWN